LLDLVRIEEAIAALQRALAINEHLPFALGGLGTAHMELGDLDAALWTFERGWQAEQRAQGKGWASNGVLLAECLRRRKELEKAREQSMRALEFTEQGDFMIRSPVRVATLSQLGKIAIDQKDLEAAKVAYDQAVTLCRSLTQPLGMDHSHEMVRALAGLSRASQDPVPFEEALQIHAKDRLGPALWSLESLLELARTARALGREEQAQAIYQRARDAGYAQEL